MTQEWMSVETEKIEKYHDLVRDLKTVWNLNVEVIGALGTTPRKLER